MAATIRQASSQIGPSRKIAASAARRTVWLVRGYWRPYHRKMPTVLRSGPYRFFFYAGDRDEPPHVHVERNDCEAKFWLDPVRLARSHGFAASEVNRIEELIVQNQQGLLDR